MKRLFASLLLVVIIFQLTGCASPTTAPTIAVIPTDPPTSVPASPTPLPTETQIPTDTPTETPLPTDTAVPTPTIEPTLAVALTPVEEIDQFLVKMNSKENFDGVVLIARDGNILLHKAYGMADHQANIPLEKDSLMPLLTFSLEAAAILLLDHQGKLSLEDPICKYLPDCPENWKSITIDNILYHSWGIPPDAITANSEVEWWESWLSPTRYEKIIRKNGEKPINPIVPPADAVWSWVNYALQDEIIEQIAGETPGEYIVKNILEPLGISHLGKNYSIEAIAAGHAIYSKVKASDPYPDNALFPYFPVSSAEDLYKLSQEYLDPKVLPVEVVDGLRKEFNYSAGSGIDTQDLIGNVNYQGWAPYPNINGKGSVNYWSYQMGYSGAQFISFEDKIVIILLTNHASREYPSLLQKIYVTLTTD